MWKPRTTVKTGLVFLPIFRETLNCPNRFFKDIMTNEYLNLFECMPVEHRTPIAKRALVVYGHSEVGIEIGTALERCCLSADVVHTGLEAMKLIHVCCPYDILITELLLDEISGFALVMVANKFPDVATIGINNGNASLKIIAYEYGIDRVLEAPLDLKELCHLSLKILGITTNTPYDGIF